MKDRRVLRGTTRTFQYTEGVQLVVDDGNFNDAWRITKFAISTVDVTSSSAGSRDCVGVLATHQEALQGYVTSVINWRWEDRRQVAWTSTAMDGDTSVGHWYVGLIDPQHIVVRDLWLGISAGTATGTTEFNYFIELERVKINDDQAILTILQEESQDVN